MTSPLLAFLLKLPLALAVFLVIAYAGTVNRRIAGVLLTFPILNGIAIIASPEPTVVADAIYPLVIFNCVLFALVMTFPDARPPVGALPRNARLFARVAAWSIAWVAGAWLLTDVRAVIPGAGVLFAGSAAFAILFMMVCWSKAGAAERAGGNPPPHGRRFIAFWANPTGAGRIAFFVLAYACLFFVSYTALDEKWVGMASALPLPGFFAVAALMDDAERAADSHTLLPMRDTLFLGPVLVIPFNWMFAQLVTAFAPDAIFARYPLLFGFWAAAALALLLLVPRLASYLDRR
jgi:hypothetical protein